MPTRRVLKSVLHNCLGTFTSRYTDYEGYWLFGFFINKVGALEFDLCGGSQQWSDEAVSAAVTFALQEFRGQMQKAGLKMNLQTERKDDDYEAGR